MPVSDGRVMSVWPCGRNNAGWESGSLRFIVMSDAGTHRASLSLLRRQRPLTLTLIDSDPAGGEHGAAVADGCLYAISGRRLVRIGSGTVKTIADNVSTRAIAYSAAYGELWLSTDDGVKVVDLASMSVYSRDNYDVGASVGQYAEIDGHTVDLSREASAPQVYVRWSGSIATGEDYRRMREARLDLRAEESTGVELAVRRVNHNAVENRAT